MLINYWNCHWCHVFRYMWNDGHYLLWQHITQVFHQDVENGLKLMPKLTFDHIKLNSFSSMHVNLAAQILSASMATVLREFSTPDTVGTALLFWLFKCTKYSWTSEEEKTFPSTIYINGWSPIRLAGRWISWLSLAVERKYTQPTREFHSKC